MRIHSWHLFSSALIGLSAMACDPGMSAMAESTSKAISKSSKGLYLVKGAHEPAKTELADFAGGCFWGVEAFFRDQPGVIATAVGFEGGHVANPSYPRVCRGDTGHAETCQIEFDPKKTTYEALVKSFFTIIDPTEVDGQGPDSGHQYRSVVFYHSDAQKKTALDVIGHLKRSDDFKGETIATEVVKAGPFYHAEEYHQQYVEKGGSAYCHTPQKRDFSK
jgi:methionine-S-sulfoxide reductase